MKMRSLPLNKLLILASASLLFISVLWDSYDIWKYFNEVKKVNTYAGFEMANLDKVNQTISLIVNNQILFLWKDKQVIFKEFYNLTDPYEIENKLAALDSFFLFHKGYDLYGIVEQKNAIANSITEKVALVNHKMLLKNCYDALLFALEGNCIFILDKYILAQNITNDSTYFGSYVYNDRKNKFKVSINEVDYPMAYDNLYSVPNSDTFRIDVTAIYNRSTYIDSTLVEYNIVKVGNKWKELK